MPEEIIKKGIAILAWLLVPCIILMKDVVMITTIRSSDKIIYTESIPDQRALKCALDIEAPPIYSYFENFTNVNTSPIDFVFD